MFNLFFQEVEQGLHLYMGIVQKTAVMMMMMMMMMIKIMYGPDFPVAVACTCEFEKKISQAHASLFMLQCGSG